MKWLIPVAALAAFIIYETKTNAAKFINTVTASLSNFKFDSSKTLAMLGTSLYFTTNINLNNTTDFSQTLNDGYLNVSYNGKPLGTATVTAKATINPKGNTTIPLNIAIPSSKIFSSILDAVAAVKSGKALTFKFTGQFNFPVGTYQLNETKNVQLS